MPLTVSATEAVGSLQFTPDGTVLAAGAEDGNIVFYNIPLVGTDAVRRSDCPADHDVGLAAVRLGHLVPGGRQLPRRRGGRPFANGSISAFDFASRGLRGRSAPTYYLSSVGVAPNGTAIVGGEVACGKVALCMD